MESLHFLICINELPDEIKTMVKLFADDTYFFTTIKGISESANALRNDISLISKCTFNWKMLFNLDRIKLSQEVLFSRKKKLQTHPTISLNNIQVVRVSY